MARSLLLQTRGALTLLAVVFALVLLAGLVRSDDPVLILFDNLRLHVAVLLALVAMLLLALQAWRRAVGFAMLAGALIVLTAVKLAPHSLLPSADTPVLKIVSFNVLNTNRANGGRIADYLASSGADIVFVQESIPIRPELEALARVFPYQAGCDDPPTRCGDVMLLSTRPLDGVEIFVLTPDSAHQAISANVTFSGRTVHLLAIHLVRPFDGPIQVGEFLALSDRIAGIDGALIVAGDFNAAPWSQPFVDMLGTTDLSRAAFEPGTWPVRLGDWGEPIDHILVRKPLRLAGLRALPNSLGSNHRGLMAEIGVSDAP